MSNISQINIGSDTFDIKDTTARSGLSNKQDILTPGQNISIVQNPTTGETVISASGGGSAGLSVSLYRYGDLIKKEYVASGTTIMLPRVDSYNDYEFAGWSMTKGTTTAPDYEAGDTITVTADVTLYAVFGKVTSKTRTLETTITKEYSSESTTYQRVTQTFDVDSYDEVDFYANRYSKIYSTSGFNPGWRTIITDNYNPYSVNMGKYTSDLTSVWINNSTETPSPDVMIHPAISTNKGNDIDVGVECYTQGEWNQAKKITWTVSAKCYSVTKTYSEYTQHYDTRDIPRYEQTEYINGIKIVEFGKGSYDELQAMISAHKAGLINIYDYWKVGDTRQIHIDAIPAYVDSDSGTTIYDAMPEQNVYATLWSTSLMSDTNVLFIVAIGAGMYNTFKVHRDTTALANGFADSDLQYYLSSYLYPAIESGFKSLLSSFSIKTFVSNSLTYEGTVYMTLPSAKEFAAGSTAAYGEGINNAFDFFTYSATSLSSSGVFASWQRVAPSNDAPYAAPYGVWTRGSAGTSGYAIGASAPVNTRSGGASVYISLFSIIPIVAIK